MHEIQHRTWLREGGKGPGDGFCKGKGNGGDDGRYPADGKGKGNGQCQGGMKGKAKDFVNSGARCKGDEVFSPEDGHDGGGRKGEGWDAQDGPHSGGGGGR